ncbi:unnamed protein product, partial [Heterotrigona itama]
MMLPSGPLSFSTGTKSVNWKNPIDGSTRLQIRRATASIASPLRDASISVSINGSNFHLRRKAINRINLQTFAV